MHQFLRQLETGGEQAAADRLSSLETSVAETARDLAYRLYTTCERKKLAPEALAYNSLVIAWPEIQRLSQKTPAEPESAMLF